MDSGVNSLRHESRRMGGRNPHEAHRVATPLELLFDLTFATSFSLAASQLADAIAAGRFMAALLGFSFASFAICWAWINFSWFSSAYDTDDWIFRIVTIAACRGVLHRAESRHHANGRHAGRSRPVVLVLALLHALHYFLVRHFRSTDAWLLISSIGVGMISVIAALSGISTAACLVLLAFAPAVTILAYELRGYQAATLAN
jgi:low temperature requirement protein LtrA